MPAGAGLYAVFGGGLRPGWAVSSTSREPLIILENKKLKLEAVYRVTGPSFTRYDVARQGEKIAEAQEASLAANKPTTAAATISTVKTLVAVPCGPRQRRSLYLHLHFAPTPTAPGAGQDKPEPMMSLARTRPAPRPGTGQALSPATPLPHLFQATQPATTASVFPGKWQSRSGHPGSTSAATSPLPQRPAG